MSTTLRPARPALARRRFTVEEYYRMAEVGVLRPDERVELLDGEVVHVSPMGSPHAACVRALNGQLAARVAGRALVCVQLPLRLDDHSEPEPDVMLVRPRDDGYASAHPGPGDALLVVEVGASSAASDREVKGPLYARAGVPELWLVDLTRGEVTCCRAPAGEGWEHVTVHRPGDTLAPAALPDLALDLEQLLGPSLRALRAATGEGTSG